MIGNQLDRQRLKGNILDRLDEALRRIRRLEETAIKPESNGEMRLTGVRLTVLSASPPPPPAGEILIYAEESSGTVYLRAKDAEDVVEDLAGWT